MDEDTSALRALVQHMEDAWNAHDGDAFAQPFAENADYVVVDGTYIQGRPIIAAGHREILSTFYRTSQNQGEVERIRLLRPDVAIVHVRWQLASTLPDGSEQQQQARATLVCQKNDGRWQIAAFQNTPIVNRPGFPTAEEVMRTVEQR